MSNHPPNQWLAKKQIEPQNLERCIQDLRQQKLTLATLNGSFDLLHAGHLYILFEAKKQADRLLVALNSDASIRQYKGPTKPIVSLSHRLSMMAAIECVDYVTWFEETDPRSLLEKIRPDVHVNGAEYGPHCIEAEVVRKHGGILHLVDRIPGLATTAIIEKIRGLP
jgi:D-glycero-beta-D-manno-heptose 1-phosphate adenylyltransferase